MSTRQTFKNLKVIYDKHFLWQKEIFPLECCMYTYPTFIKEAEEIEELLELHRIPYVLTQLEMSKHSETSPDELAFCRGYVIFTPKKFNEVLI